MSVVEASPFKDWKYCVMKIFLDLWRVDIDIEKAKKN